MKYIIAGPRGRYIETLTSLAKARLAIQDTDNVIIHGTKRTLADILKTRKLAAAKRYGHDIGV
jgi:hypothetical protein